MNGALSEDPTYLPLHEDDPEEDVEEEQDESAGHTNEVNLAMLEQRGQAIQAQRLGAHESQKKQAEKMLEVSGKRLDFFVPLFYLDLLLLTLVKQFVSLSTQLIVLRLATQTFLVLLWKLVMVFTRLVQNPAFFRNVLHETKASHAAATLCFSKTCLIPKLRSGQPLEMTQSQEHKV